jgi:hypothetical protein
MASARATIANTNTTVLSNSRAGIRYEVASLVFCNIGASTEVLTVYVVPQGGSAGTSNAIVKSWNVNSSDTFPWAYGPIYLETGDSIVAIGTTGSLLTATAEYISKGAN